MAPSTNPSSGIARETVAYSSTIDTDNDVGYSYLHNPDSTWFSEVCDRDHKNRRRSRPLTAKDTRCSQKTNRSQKTRPRTEQTAFSDSKDWTWVLERTCPECGFDASSMSLAELPDALRDNAVAWKEILEGPSDRLRDRPRPDVWSPLEYAFHVRDVFELYHYRLGLMLDEDGPSYPNWDQDETAVAKDYRNADADDRVARAGRMGRTTCFSIRRGERRCVEPNRVPQRWSRIYGRQLRPVSPPRPRPSSLGRAELAVTHRFSL